MKYLIYIKPGKSIQEIQKFMKDFDDDKVNNIIITNSMMKSYIKRLTNETTKLNKKICFPWRPPSFMLPFGIAPTYLLSLKMELQGCVVAV